jgi:hypothetical protein
VLEDLEEVAEEVPQKSSRLRNQRTFRYKPRELTPFRMPDPLPFNPNGDTFHGLQLPNLSKTVSFCHTVRPTRIAKLKKTRQTPNIKVGQTKPNNSPIPNFAVENPERLKESNSNKARTVLKSMGNKEVADLRAVLGRPLLSSTKLYPEDPKIPDKPKKLLKKLRPMLRQKAFLIETNIGDASTTKEADSKIKMNHPDEAGTRKPLDVNAGTSICNENTLKRKMNDAAIKNKKSEEVLEDQFNIADMVNKLELQGSLCALRKATISLSTSIIMILRTVE